MSIKPEKVLLLIVGAGEFVAILATAGHYFFGVPSTARAVIWLWVIPIAVSAIPLAGSLLYIAFTTRRSKNGGRR